MRTYAAACPPPPPALPPPCTQCVRIGRDPPPPIPCVRTLRMTPKLKFSVSIIHKCAVIFCSVSKDIPRVQHFGQFENVKFDRF